MKGHDPGTYAAKVGADYDLLYPGDPLETEATVAALDALARSAAVGGSILEFGIGTGRLGLPLLERGLRVAGIEASETMIAQMRAKPRGDEIEVVLGDFLSAARRNYGRGQAATASGGSREGCWSRRWSSSARSRRVKFHWNGWAISL